MKKSILIVLTVALFLTSFSSCDPDDHSATDHPCNFPDAETENNLWSYLSYKIIDKGTSVNLVDTTLDAAIHVDSVFLMNYNFDTIPSIYEYYIDNWIFTNFTAYYDVPFHDPDALLSLDYLLLYLRTSHNDLDTIGVYFEQCLIDKVVFNGNDTFVPDNEPYHGGTTFYFKK